jgi:ribA/ribD-fused uncharacterized protein
MARQIERFINEYAFLSNFHLATVRWDGKLWKSVEHAYQAAKTLDEEQREMIRATRTPGEAKRLGQAVNIRPDWDNVKLDIMRELIHEKFMNPFLRHRLLETGDAELIEMNFWNDKFWGICRGEGKNHLGRILMDERDSIKEEITADNATAEELRQTR